ncbi:MAG: aminotransferase class IV [Crocinitomicaceae bacterium]|nr:aminotransferase class IV [Crocinitomicaceae bacterium]
MVHGTHNAIHDDRNESIIIYINGVFHVRNEAKISVFDSGYLIGDGIWEGIRLTGSKLVFVEEHLNRLWQAAKATHINMAYSKAELIEIIYKTLEKNNMTDEVHIRVMITRGIKKTPSQDPRLTITGPNLVIIPEYKMADESSKKSGLKLFTSTIRRGSPDYLDPKLNCHSKLHEVQALVQAIEAGADEALMLDINGFVSTCNSTNFFMVKDGVVITSTDQYCMNGITRQKIIDLCVENNMPVVEKNFSLYDVYDADECFVTGTFAGISPVISIDGRTIENKSNNEISASLSILYKKLISDYVRK